MPLRIKVAELQEGRGVTRVRRLPDQGRGAGNVLADIFAARVEHAERSLSLRVAGFGRPVQPSQPDIRIARDTLAGEAQISEPKLGGRRQEAGSEVAQDRRPTVEP